MASLLSSSNLAVGHHACERNYSPPTLIHYIIRAVFSGGPRPPISAERCAIATIRFHPAEHPFEKSHAQQNYQS